MQPILIAGAFGAAWSLYYVCITMVAPTRRPEWCSRIVSGTHGVVSCILAGIALSVGPHPVEGAGGENDSAQELAIVVSIGYFVYDIVWMAFYTPDEIVFMCHHFTATAGLCLALLSGRSGIETCVTVFMMELTNPLLQARWFIRDAGYKTSTLFKVVDLSYIGLFVFCRVVVGTYYLYQICIHPEIMLAFKIISVAFQCVSLALLIPLMKYFHRKYLSAAPQQDADT